MTLDRELKRRGHRFVRDADDCDIYVRSGRAGHRVLEGRHGFLTLTRYLRGWRGYFGFWQTQSVRRALDSWLHLVENRGSIGPAVPCQLPTS
jgi:hypothetical protein